MSRRRRILIAVEVAALGLAAALHLAGLHAMAHWRVMESVLAIDMHTSAAALAGTALFLLLRLGLFLVLPGWVLARVFLVVTRPADGSATTSGRRTAPRR